MSVQSTIESLLKLKPVDRQLALAVAEKMSMSVDIAGVVTGPVTSMEEGPDGKRHMVSLGEKVILCFEFNFMDERRERLREQQANILPDPKAPRIGDEYSTTIGRIVVSNVWLNGDVTYYLNGAKHSSDSFHRMLRSIADVTPMVHEQ